MTSAPPPAVDDSAQATMDLEREYVLQNYARYPLVLRRGKGPYVYDLEGRRYLDFIAGIGVNALGHAHPRIVKLIRQQAATLIHCSNLYYHEYQGTLAKKLAEVSGLQRTFFCNSGRKRWRARSRWRGRTATKSIPERSRSSRSTTRSTAARWARYRSPDSPSTGTIS